MFARPLSSLLVILVVAGLGRSQSLAPLATFGGGDGWRAPNEILAGDTAGSNNGTNYSYLGTANNERGLAYNPATGNLILVNRIGTAVNVRILNGVTGADTGGLAGTGTLTGGTFAASMVGVASDGAIYVGNLQTNVSTTAFKVYQWASETATAPTVAFNNTVSGFNNITSGQNPRLGDSLAVTGSGTSTQIAAGVANANGYALLSTADGTNFTAAAVSPASTGSFAAGDMRLGITFANTTQNGAEVWGKQTGNPIERLNTNPATPTRYGSVAVLSSGEGPMAFTTITVNGNPLNLLATLDATNATSLSVVRVYNVNDPNSPVLLASGTTTSGTLTANGNGVGSVTFGSFNPDTSNLVIYAMNTNQGIQAFNFNPVPEPAHILAIGAVVAFGAKWRARRRAAVTPSEPVVG